ncbi:MAG: hypothetical protein LAT56_07045 [Wenzhouxiangella sp.]|nr:hypothetical protein [Wenzhouxiangella sp.]
MIRRLACFLMLRLALALTEAEAESPPALQCETRAEYIESLQASDDHLQRQLGPLYTEPDARHCRSIRVRVQAESDFDWNLRWPDLSFLAWSLRAVAVVLLVIACLWLLRHWKPGVRMKKPDGQEPGVRLPGLRRSRPTAELQLPANIPAAADEAWLAGQHRLALSLLYQGAVESLLPERSAAAHTEGEVLAELVRRHLKTEALDWMRQLTGAWQRMAWAGLSPGDGEFEQLLRDWPRHCRGRPS